VKIEIMEKELKNEILNNLFEKLRSRDIYCVIEKDLISDYDWKLHPKIIRSLIKKIVDDGYVKSKTPSMTMLQIDSLGEDVLDYDSWTDYVNRDNEIISKNNKRQKLRDKIDRLNLLELKHNEKIRKQEDRIRNLEEQLKIINLIKVYWWLIGLGVLLGALLVKLLYYIF